MKDSIALCALICFAFTDCRAHSRSASVAAVHICDIARTPTTYDGRVVCVSAQVHSDGIERVTLSDTECPDFGLRVARGASRETSLDSLKHAVLGSSPGTLDKDVTGVFVGTIRVASGGFPAQIELLSASNIVVTQRHH